MKSTNTEIKLGMHDLPSFGHDLEVLGNISESEVIELPTRKQKWTQEVNKMLWKCCFESDKNVRRYMERMYRLWIERGGRDLTKQRLRTQVQNIEKKNLFSDVEIGEIVGDS